MSRSSWMFWLFFLSFFSLPYSLGSFYWHIFNFIEILSYFIDSFLTHVQSVDEPIKGISHICYSVFHFQNFLLSLKKFLSPCLHYPSVRPCCFLFPLEPLTFFFFFWLGWVFVAMHRLSLIAESRGYSSVVVCGLFIAVASLLPSMDSRRAGFSSCGTLEPLTYWSVKFPV